MAGVFIKAKVKILFLICNQSVSIARKPIIQLISVSSLTFCSNYQLHIFFLYVILLSILIFFAVIEISSGEYGVDCLDRMVSIVDNGRIHKWTPSLSDLDASIVRRKDRVESLTTNCAGKIIESFVEEITPDYLRSKCTSFQQFCILFRRMSKQIYRNKVSFWNTLDRNVVGIQILYFLAELHSNKILHARISWISDRRTVLPNGKWRYQNSI